ncbi:MAG TPA: hypothetical protein VFR18_15130 [Terriglobia bacterium]|nr:hypothetical protein [Terriglobia bacterium]
MLFARQPPHDISQRPSRAKQLHLHSGDGLLLESGNLRNGPFLDIKELESDSFTRIELCQPVAKKPNASFQIEAFLKARRLRKDVFIKFRQFFRLTTPAPVIAHGVADDLAEERPRITHFKLLPESLNSLERGVLFEVFVVEWTARPTGSNKNEQTNFNRIDVHVTSLPGERLYVT